MNAEPLSLFDRMDADPAVDRWATPAPPAGMRAHARRTDPDTSHEAAASITTADLAARHAAVLELLRWAPATDEELAARHAKAQGARQSPSGLRTRRAELVALGLVRDSGDRRPTASGRAAVVWHLAPNPKEHTQ